MTVVGALLMVRRYAACGRATGCVIEDVIEECGDEEAIVEILDTIKRDPLACGVAFGRYDIVGEA